MRSADVVTRSILLDPWDPSLKYPVDRSHDAWVRLYDDNTTATLDFPVVRYISDISPYEAGFFFFLGGFEAGAAAVLLIEFILFAHH